MLERFAEPPSLPENTDAVTAMAHRLKTQTGRAPYALRKQTVEPVFGIIKQAMQFRQFLLRGVERVGYEPKSGDYPALVGISLRFWRGASQSMPVKAVVIVWHTRIQTA